MKATDLMVGDFVNVNDLPLRVGAIRQDELGFFDNDYKIYWCSDDEFDRIDPIPLTEDILVKNGFDCQYYDDGNSYWWAVFDGWFNINFDHSDCSEGEFRCVNFRDLVIKSVHQLQHLLRLCGIEKEIEL